MLVMCILIGNWLEGSGWNTSMSQSNISSAETAESFFKVSNFTKTRRSHQITIETLYILMTMAYFSYLEEGNKTLR